jgi:hypothetical protein
MQAQQLHAIATVTGVDIVVRFRGRVTTAALHTIPSPTWRHSAWRRLHTFDAVISKQTLCTARSRTTADSNGRLAVWAARRDCHKVLSYLGVRLSAIKVTRVRSMRRRRPFVRLRRHGCVALHRPPTSRLQRTRAVMCRQAGPSGRTAMRRCSTHQNQPLQTGQRESARR